MRRLLFSPATLFFAPKARRFRPPLTIAYPATASARSSDRGGQLIVIAPPPPASTASPRRTSLAAPGTGQTHDTDRRTFGTLAALGLARRRLRARAEAAERRRHRRREPVAEHVRGRARRRRALRQARGRRRLHRLRAVQPRLRALPPDVLTPCSCGSQDGLRRRAAGPHRRGHRPPPPTLAGRTAEHHLPRRHHGSWSTAPADLVVPGRPGRRGARSWSPTCIASNGVVHVIDRSPAA